jgi:hypothetical protein
MNLETLQREMAAAILLPLTPNEDMRAEGPDGRRMSDVAASFIAPNSRLTAFERLEIYNRQYWFRVLGALADDFPGLRAVIGSKAFEQVVFIAQSWIEDAGVAGGESTMGWATQHVGD